MRRESRQRQACLDPISLRPWLFLFLLKESKQRHAGYLHNLKPDSRNISNGMPLPSKSRNQHLILHQTNQSLLSLSIQRRERDSHCTLLYFTQNPLSYALGPDVLQDPVYWKEKWPHKLITWVTLSFYLLLLRLTSSFHHRTLISYWNYTFTEPNRMPHVHTPVQFERIWLLLR